MTDFRHLLLSKRIVPVGNVCNNQICTPYADSANMTVIRHNLPASLTLPHLNRNTVENPNLPSWLEDCVQASLVLAVAPAGFGKTTAILGIHEHLREAGVKTAWIQLNPDDNHLDRFCQLIYAAITPEAASELKNDEVTTNLIDAVYTSTSFNFRLLDLLANLPHSTAIFLDDFDHITDPHILQIVQNMIERAGKQCRFIIAARAQPQLKLLKLRAQGKVILIGFRELAFDIEQTRTFFNARYQLELDDASIERLHQSTEGWPTGLQLAALAMEKRKDRQNFIKNFQSSAADIDHYLYEEVFLTQSQDVQNFLLKTSVVTQLNISLTNAIANINNSAALLRGIEQQNLFLVRVGDSDAQYRFHPLFAEYLKKKLHEECHALVPGLHVKAAEWYLRNDNPGSAIDHLLIAGNDERVCEILATYIWVGINAGQLSDCHRWLNAIKPAVLDNHPELLVAKCWMHIFQHEYALARNLAYRLRNRAELENNNDYRILEPLTLALMDQPRDCESVLVSQLNNVTFSGPVAGVLHTIRAAVHMWTHQFDKVPSELDSAQAIFRQYGSLYGLSYTIGIEANVLLVQAKVKEAIAVLESGFADIVRRSGQNSVCSAHLAGYLAEALYEIGDYERAFKLADEYFDLTCATGMTYTIIASFRLLSRSRCNTGNYVLAREMIERGIELGRQLSLQSVSVAMQLELLYQSIQQYDAEQKEQLRPAPLEGLAWSGNDQKAASDNNADYIRIMQFRIWLRSGRSQSVIDDAPRFIIDADQRNSTRVAIKLRILLAQAMDMIGDTKRALDEILAVFQISKGQRLVSTFIEEGPRLISLLEKLALEPIEPTIQAHIRHILSMTNTIKQSPPGRLASDSIVTDTVPAPLVIKSIDALSDRELQILQCLAAGMPNKSIAGKLFITEPTVKFHLRNINSKLRAKNRTHAVFIGRQLGVIHN